MDKHIDILIELLIYYLSKKYIISSQQIEDIAYLWNWDVDQVKQIYIQSNDNSNGQT